VAEEVLGLLTGLGIQLLERLVKLGLVVSYPGASQKAFTAYTLEDAVVGGSSLYYAITTERRGFWRWLEATYGVVDLMSVPFELVVAFVLWVLGVDPSEGAPG